MKKIVKGALLFGGVSGGLLGTAGDVFAETFVSALSKAYNTNPSIKAQRATVRQADESVNQAYAGWKPTVTGTLTGTKSNTRVSQRPAGSTLNANYETRTGSAQVTGSYNIFKGWQTVSSTNSAKAAVYAARADLVQAEQDVLLAAATAFVDTITNTKVVATNKSNVNVLNKQLEATRVRVKVGDLTRSNTYQVQADVEDAKARLNNAQAQLALARANYERIVGETPSDLEMPQDRPVLPGCLEDAKKMALEGNPSIIKAKFQEQGSKADIRKAQGSLAPSFDVNASAGRQKTFRATPGTATSRGSHQDNMSVTATLTIPIYQAGTNYSQIRSAHQVASQRKLNLEVTKRKVLEDVTKAWEQLDSARGNIKKFKAKSKAALSALEGIREEQRVGSRTTLEVLDAEQKYFESKVQLAQEERNELIAVYTLLSNMGQLTSHNLNLPVDHYNPEVHYNDVKFRPIGWAPGKSGESSGAN